MARLAILLFGLVLAGCSAPLPDAGSAPGSPDGSPEGPAGRMGREAPARIVSLDYCADQFVLRFADRARILALSPDAGKDFSYMRESAAGLPTVRPVAEDVLILRPDLVVRSYGGGPGAATMFRRAGIPVLEIGWSADFEAVMATVERVASGLGAAAKGRAVAAEMRDRLAAVAARSGERSALYMTPGGVTTGPGSLVHEMLEAAGLRNFEDAPGWRPIPLETLAYDQPDLVAAAFYESLVAYPDAWTTARHPIARDLVEAGDVVTLDSAVTSCGAWFLVDAVETLAAVGRAGDGSAGDDVAGQDPPGAVDAGEGP